jgi:hypothetical protein
LKGIGGMKRSGSMMVLLALALLAFLPGSVKADALRDHLSVFFEFNALDSVIALEQKSATSLQVTVADGATGETRNLREDVGAKPMQKLLAEANDLGLKTLPLATSAPEAESDKPGKTEKIQTAPAASDKPAVKRAAAAEPSGRSVSSQRKNRMWYIATQSALTTYVYGISIPIAFDVKSSRVQIATPMIIAPLAFGAHFWYAKNRPFEDSHLKGTNYLSIASLYASYALPYSIMDESNDRFRMASLLSIATYPLGIWAGYELGDKYVDLPGRIDTQEKFAFGFGLMGFFSPFLYYSRLQGHEEEVIRLALGQSVAMATLGHFLADHYRSGENIPTGVNTGIMDHTGLGVGLGLEVAALADASAPQPWIGAALLGGTLGFMEGLFYYRNSYDSQERGLYNTLGGMAGTLLGGGLAYLFVRDGSSDYVKKTSITSYLVVGTLAGYCITDILTDGLEDRTGLKENKSWTSRLAFNPIPMPEAQFRDREMYLRYRMPGLSYRF